MSMSGGATSSAHGNKDNNMRILEQFKDFKYAELEEATKGFAKENEIAKSGSAVIYEGELKTGLIRRVAIKCFQCPPSSQLREKFIPLAFLEHANVTKLVGCCLEEKTILVYEHTPNGTLDKYNEINREKLLVPEEPPHGWLVLFQIVKGIAEGVAYMHKSGKYVKRRGAFLGDLKPSDIFLDSDVKPKISNIGISRILEGQSTYRAPEYAGSIKSDVYSFGAIALEIITGENHFKVGWRLENGISFTPQQARDWLDTFQNRHGRSAHNCGLKISRCMKAAMFCVRDEPVKRPTMDEVVGMINGNISVDDWDRE